MTKKYHVNPDTGKSGICKAKIKCDFNLSEDEHYASAEEASLAYEATQNDSLFAQSTTRVQVKPKQITQDYIMSNLKNANAQTVNSAIGLLKSLDIDEYAHELQFEDTHGKLVSMKDLAANPLLASGRCDKVSKLIQDELEFDLKMNDVKIETFEVNYGAGGTYSANKLTFNDGSIVVMDYTAAIHDKNIKGPLIEDSKKWALRINSNLKRLHNCELDKESLSSLQS